MAWSRGCVVLSLLITTSLAVPLGVGGTGGSCADVSTQWTGTIAGGPEETVAPSVDAVVHELALGSSLCQVASLDVSLTWSDDNADLDLRVSWEGLELDSSASATPGEHVNVSDIPTGTYQFQVEPWAAPPVDYVLTAKAHLVDAPTITGSNADDPFVVIAVVDTGINPYHREFSETTYPDSAVNLSVHPSTYIEKYPASAGSLDLSIGATDYATAVAADAAEWNGVQTGKLYWIPGTKIIGAYYGAGGLDSGRPILDENGHGTASAGVAVGNTVGSCTKCLLVAVEGIGGLNWALSQPWIDLVTNSWSIGFGLPGVEVPTAGVASSLTGFAETTKAATDRGQTVLFAAGNGWLNAFLTPMTTLQSSVAGPEWIMTVGAVAKFSGNCDGEEGTIIGSGKPVDVSSYGLGDIPSVPHNSVSGPDQHSGTSAATPIVAGVMGEALLHARTLLGDTTGGNSGGVIATGTATSAGMLADGNLTRTELETAIEHTARHTVSSCIGIVPTSPPTAALPAEARPATFPLEGWGVVNPETGADAADVIDGTAALPDRPIDEAFDAADSALRTALWGPLVV